MIRTESLTKLYTMNGKTVAALDHVSLHVREGEYTAIVGPSGSGKSTLMHILGCLDTPTSGSYHLHGRDVSTLGKEELARVRGEEIGFVFQGFQLLPRLTAEENVALPLLLCGKPPKERAATARALLEQVGLGERLRHTPSQLSGGQQQRVAIARALARDPAVLLADEPTGNLDAQSTAEVLSLLDDLHRAGRTILLITHDSVVAQRAQRQIAIASGRIISDSAKDIPVFSKISPKFITK
ncbi:MAG: ABC transporter ATP-binding protein [Clostridiales bacterium]|nr:ABC transporter ATP-binding protein [Clostridiales bacterium]